MHQRYDAYDAAGFPETSMNDSPVSPRRRLRTLVLILALFAASAAAVLWWYRAIGQWRETTENAYLTGNLVTVSAEVRGTVVRIAAEENDSVSAGAELINQRSEVMRFGC